MSVKNLIYGASLLTLLSAPSCSPKSDTKNKDEPKKEVKEQDEEQKSISQNDPYGNVALFEASRSKIKFALAIVENYYPYTYKDGNGNWTTGEGLTELWNENGKMTKVTKNTSPVTLAQSDVYKGRYLTYSVLPKIKQGFKAPADENALIAVTVLGYCVGPQWIVNSEFTKKLNAGKKGAELATYLAGFCASAGVPKRMYFLAALVAGEAQWSDLLDLRAEGCYNLTWQDIFVCDKNGNPIKKNGYRQWDFSKLKKNLEKAKGAKSTELTLNGNKKVTVKCKLAKEIVPDYIWQEVSNGRSAGVATSQNTTDFVAAEQTYTCGQLNDSSYIAYQKGDYKTSLNAALNALQLAQTDKEIGASAYNTGMAHLALGDYERAVRFLKKSYEANPTKAAKTALDEAIPKRNANRCWYGLGAFGIGAAGLAARRGLKGKGK